MEQKSDTTCSAAKAQSAWVLMIFDLSCISCANEHESGRVKTSFLATAPRVWREAKLKPHKRSQQRLRLCRRPRAHCQTLCAGWCIADYIDHVGDIGQSGSEASGSEAKSTARPSCEGGKPRHGAFFAAAR